MSLVNRNRAITVQFAGVQFRGSSTGIREQKCRIFQTEMKRYLRRVTMHADSANMNFRSNGVLPFVRDGHG